MLWNDLFETGIEEVDRQNYDLIARVEAMMNPESDRARLVQLENFEKIVNNYFKLEQAMHGGCNYFDLEAHRYSHEIYLKKLRQVKQNFSNGGATLEKENIFRKDIVEYLKKHIMWHDQTFAYFYKNDRMPVSLVALYDLCSAGVV